MSCSMYLLFKVPPPSASPSLRPEGSDLVGFHKLSNFQLFNDLDGVEPCRQTDRRSGAAYRASAHRLYPLRHDLGMVSLWERFSYS